MSKNITGRRFKAIRRELGLSQESIGAQGFVSAPGYIKIENGQRAPSEKMIERFTTFLVDGKHMRPAAAKTLRVELLTAKYMDSKSPYMSGLATQEARTEGMSELIALQNAQAERAKRGRPAGSIYTSNGHARGATVHDLLKAAA